VTNSFEGLSACQEGLYFMELVISGTVLNTSLSKLTMYGLCP